MTREVKLNQLRAVLDSLDYPLANEAAREALADVTLLYANGEEPLSAVVSRSTAETFEDAEDLEAEVYNNLPVEAVGEPGQSEGEG